MFGLASTNVRPSFNGSTARLIYDLDRRADYDHGEEFGRVIRVQPDPSMGAKTVAPPCDGRMHTKRGQAQLNPISSKRIVRTGRDHLGLNLFPSWATFAITMKTPYGVRHCGSVQSQDKRRLERRY